MKRILLLTLLLFALKVSAQQTYWSPGIPPSSSSFSPTFRYLGTDSLAGFYLGNYNRWSQLYTATQINGLFLPLSLTKNTTVANNGFAMKFTEGVTIGNSSSTSLRFFGVLGNSGSYPDTIGFGTTLYDGGGAKMIAQANGQANALYVPMNLNYPTYTHNDTIRHPIAIIDTCVGCVFSPSLHKLTVSSSGGTVTNISAGYGMNFTAITSTGPVKADSTVLQTVLNFFPKGDTRYYKSSNPSGYISGNQTISFSPTGDVTGNTSGTTSLAPALSIGAGKVTNSMLAGSIDLTSKVTGILSVANGGTGTASPGIVAGTNITVTGTWPNQTVNTILGFTRQIITSGSSGTVTGGNYLVTIDPSSTIASYTLTLPASPSDLNVVQVDFGGTLTSGTIVTALTIAPNSGQTILDNTPPVNATADNTLLYRYRASNSTWYRFKP